MPSDERFLQNVIDGNPLSIEQIDNMVLAIQDGHLKLDQMLACACYALKNNVFKNDRSLFLTHCENVYGYKSKYAYRLAQAGAVYTVLSTIVEKEQWPKSISQAVALSKLGEIELVELWKSLCESGEQKSMNCSKLKCYVQEVIDRNNAAKMIAEPAEPQVRSKPNTKLSENVEEVCGSDEVEERTEVDAQSVVETSGIQDDEGLDEEKPYHSRDYGYGTPDDFPPFGIDRENRLVMAAVGVKFYRLDHRDEGPCIMEWDEECRAWQQLLPVQKGIIAIWEKLIKKPGVCQC
jgi:hypothetical protein